MVKFPAFRRRQSKDYHQGESTFNSFASTSSFGSIESDSDDFAGPPAVERLYTLQDIETGSNVEEQPSQLTPRSKPKKVSNPEGLIVPVGTFA